MMVKAHAEALIVSVTNAPFTKSGPLVTIVAVTLETGTRTLPAPSSREGVTKQVGLGHLGAGAPDLPTDRQGDLQAHDNGLPRIAHLNVPRVSCGHEGLRTGPDVSSQPPPTPSP